MHQYPHQYAKDSGTPEKSKKHAKKKDSGSTPEANGKQMVGGPIRPSPDPRTLK